MTGSIAMKSEMVVMCPHFGQTKVMSPLMTRPVRTSTPMSSVHPQAVIPHLNENRMFTGDLLVNQGSASTHVDTERPMPRGNRSPFLAAHTTGSS